MKLVIATSFSASSVATHHCVVGCLPHWLWIPGSAKPKFVRTRADTMNDNDVTKTLSKGHFQFYRFFDNEVMHGPLASDLLIAFSVPQTPLSTLPEHFLRLP